MKKNAVIAISAVCLAVLAVGVFAGARPRPKTVSVLVHEAGTALPPPSAFLLTPDADAAYTAESLALDTGVLGEFPIGITAGGKTYASALRITDTTPPQGRPVARAAFSGGVLAPEAFVENITDATPVAVGFSQPPDFDSPGESEVGISLRDAAGNTSRITAPLTVYGVKQVELEIGASRDSLAPGDFVAGNFLAGGASGLRPVFVTDLSTVDFYKTGVYTITLRLEGSTADAGLRIIDTTPPSAVPAAVDGWLGDELTAMDFLTDVFDYSDVTAEFVSPPDMTKEGTQEVGIRLTDASGNSSLYTAPLKLKRDTLPPVISGEIHKHAFIGDSLAYRAGVTAVDNRDGGVAVSVDSSAVNVYVDGVYPVYYSAVDRLGHSSAVTGSVTVYSVSEERVYEMADEILARIIDESMTLEERAKKIYDWVRMNVKYVNTGEKDVVIFGAYRAIQKHSGDCYTFYAISEVLLTRAEVPNIGVSRVGGRSKHFWQIINAGTGWYHFDTTPYQTYRNTFMFTETQAEELTRQSNTLNYYVYDKDLYPEVVQ